MLHLSRRRFTAALAAIIAGLGIRRAVARPVRIEPTLAEPEPWMPSWLKEREPPEYCLDGVWLEDGGHRVYYPGTGWVHMFRPMRHNKLASWYGPPPPYGKSVIDDGRGSRLTCFGSPIASPVKPESHPIPSFAASAEPFRFDFSLRRPQLLPSLSVAEQRRLQIGPYTPRLPYSALQCRESVISAKRP